MGWVKDKIDEIGLEQFLQDQLDELSDMTDEHPCLHYLVQDLGMTLGDYEQERVTGPGT